MEGGRSRRMLRGGLTLVAVLALATVWRTASTVRAAAIAAADRHAAALLAEYLGAATTPARSGWRGSDARLLSAAGALIGASFWSGGAQVWLEGNPLFPPDTTGTGAAVAPLRNADGSVRGAVAAWGSIPVDAGERMETVSGALALLAIVVAVMGGILAERPRLRVVLTLTAAAVVVGGILGQLAEVTATERAAADSGLLLTRRVLEVAALGRRLTAAEVDRLAAGLVATPLEGATATRDTVVRRDSTGAWVVVLASRGQAWRLSDPDAAPGRGPARVRILLFGFLALFATLAAAALPVSAGYLTGSRREP